VSLAGHGGRSGSSSRCDAIRDDKKSLPVIDECDSSRPMLLPAVVEPAPGCCWSPRFRAGMGLRRCGGLASAERGRCSSGLRARWWLGRAARSWVASSVRARWWLGVCWGVGVAVSDGGTVGWRRRQGCRREHGALADRAESAASSLLLELALAGPSAWPGADEDDADAGGGDDLDEACAGTGLVAGDSPGEVVGGAAEVVPSVAVGAVEVEQVAGGRGAGALMPAPPRSGGGRRRCRRHRGFGGRCRQRARR
jgi:hypothetical protein